MDTRNKITLPFELQQQCTNCNACGQVCPRNCIYYQDGRMHFIEENCIGCNLCAKACPSLNLSSMAFSYPKEAYAAWSLDTVDRASSTSGGAASVFYNQALAQGWHIVGAAYNNQLLPELCVTNRPEMVAAFKQSKYVYSSTVNCYRQVKTLLCQDVGVLFIGLPCQVAGLLRFLGKKYQKLITVDIVCHGTPSPQILREYIAAKDPDKKAVALRFRYDNAFCFALTDSSGNTVYRKRGRTDAYLAAFLEGIDYQTQCYSCQYAKPERVSDLTIGDFWGLGAEKPFEHPYTGAISLVLVNSEAGKEFLLKCAARLFLEQRPVSEAIQGNAQLCRPTPAHPKRDELWKMLQSNIPFSDAVSSLLRNEIKQEKRKLRKQDVRTLGSKLKRAILRRKP